MTDDLEQERATLAGVYADLGARIDDLESSRAGVRARLLELGSGPAGTLRVLVNPVRRLNSVRFEEKYPATEYPGYYEQKVRTALAKALDDPTVYDQGTPQLRVVDAD